MFQKRFSSTKIDNKEYCPLEYEFRTTITGPVKSLFEKNKDTRDLNPKNTFISSLGLYCMFLQ